MPMSLVLNDTKDMVLKAQSWTSEPCQSTPK